MAICFLPKEKPPNQSDTALVTLPRTSPPTQNAPNHFWLGAFCVWLRGEDLNLFSLRSGLSGRCSTFGLKSFHWNDFYTASSQGSEVLSIS